MASNTKSFADEVTGSPEGQLRLTLLEAALARKFEEDEYNQYLDQLAATDHDPTLHIEIARARHSTYDQTPEISFHTTSRQLLWAATVFRQATEAAKDGRNYTNTPFFRHLINQPVFQQELLRHARTLSDHFDRNKTRIRWGAPLSWFYFSPTENLINLDPFHGLVFGLPRHPQDHAHSRFPADHENGHAILSKELPPSFQNSIDRLQQLSEKTPSLTDAEREEIIDKRIEAMLWGQFYNLAEDNVANRFALIRGQDQYGQDYAQSIKYVYALINQSRKSFEDFKSDQWARYVKSGHDFLEKIKAGSAIEQFNSLCKVLGMAVPVNEGLFDNQKMNWQKSGVEWAAFMPSLNDAEKIAAAATLLAEGDGMSDSISHQQPYIYRATSEADAGTIAGGVAKIFDRFFRYSTADNAIIHSADEVQRAVKARNAVIERLWQKYVASLLPEIKSEIRQQLQQSQQSMQDMADQIPGPPSSGMGTPGNSDHDKQQEQQSKPDKGDDPSGDAKKDKKSGGGKEKEQKPDNQDNNAGSIGNEQNNDPGKTIEDIVQDGDRQAAAEGQRQQEQEGRLQDVVRQAQQSVRPIEYDFPEGDWSNYQAAKQRLTWLTNIFIRQLDDIRKKQIELHIKRGRQLEMLPEGSEIDRLDREAQFRLAARANAQVPLRADDFKRFVGNKTDVKLTTPQLALLIDGSQSMEDRMDGTEGVAPIDIAISAGVAFYEATNHINARVADPRPAFECYSGIWGPTNPTWLTYPEIEPSEAGSNFDRFRGGLQSYTNLGPALGMLIEKLGTANSKAKNIGATHVVILSDGDIQDASNTSAKVIKLVENIPNLTIDIVLISAEEDAKIVQVFRETKEQYPRLNYGVHRIASLDQMPLTCLKALRQRMVRNVMSVPRAAKAAEFKRAALG